METWKLQCKDTHFSCEHDGHIINIIYHIHTNFPCSQCKEHYSGAAMVWKTYPVPSIGWLLEMRGDIGRLWAVCDTTFISAWRPLVSGTAKIVLGVTNLKAWQKYRKQNQQYEKQSTICSYSKMKLPLDIKIFKIKVPEKSLFLKSRESEETEKLYVFEVISNFSVRLL